MWYDPSVPRDSPTNLPTTKHFEDMGIVVARSDWSGNESMVVFKCGPPLGHYFDAHARLQRHSLFSRVR